MAGCYFPILIFVQSFLDCVHDLVEEDGRPLVHLRRGEIGVLHMLQFTLTNLLCYLRILLHSSILYQTCKQCLKVF